MLPPLALGWATLWILCRLVGAVVTAPLTEELAFRGYLARRSVAGDFERVPLDRLPWLAVLGSALAFGMLHHRLVAATLAGIACAVVARRRGSLADAVVAHATTNAVLALWGALHRQLGALVGARRPSPCTGVHSSRPSRSCGTFPEHSTSSSS